MCIMCRSNLASYIPYSGPLGISLDSFGTRGISPHHPASKVKSRSQWNFPWGGISQEIMEKREMLRVGYVRRPIWTTHYKKRPKTAEQLNMSWLYVIFYNLGRCRLEQRSKAASKIGQILLKNTNINIETPCRRGVHIEIWNISENDCIFRPKPCNDLFV